MKTKVSTKPKLTNRGRNNIYDFVLVSSDYCGMEMAYSSLPYGYRRSEVGSGYCLMTGARDYHFCCRGYDRAMHIVNHYSRLIRRRKRGGFKVFDNYDYDQEND